MRDRESNPFLSIANTLYHETFFHGGCTINVKTLQRPTRGYAVSTIEGPQFTHKSDIVPAKISEFIKENDDLEHVGGWEDPSTGICYFDMVSIFNSFEAACIIAKDHGQIAIYDLGNKQVITAF